MIDGRHTVRTLSQEVWCRDWRELMATPSLGLINVAIDAEV